MNKGISVEMANNIADHILLDPSSEQTRNAKRLAFVEYKLLHDGKRLPVIGYAYRQGMRSTMSQSYYQKAQAAEDTLAIEVSYTMKRIQIASEQKQAVNSEGYKAFYQSFSDEVYRLSGERPDAPAFEKGWEQTTMLEYYRDSDDPLYVAARFCDEHNCTKETFSTFETYRAAVLYELTRYVTDKNMLEQWTSALTDTPLRNAFSLSMHPRRAAYGYYRSCMRRSASAA